MGFKSHNNSASCAANGGVSVGQIGVRGIRLMAHLSGRELRLVKREGLECTPPAASRCMIRVWARGAAPVGVTIRARAWVGSLPNRGRERPHIHDATREYCRVF